MIALEKEPEEMGEPCERCCFCGEITDTWAVKKDVPCCIGCANLYSEFEVPSKEDWISRG